MAFEIKIESAIKYNDVYREGDHYVGLYVLRESNLRVEIRVLGNEKSVLRYEGTTFNIKIKKLKGNEKLESSLCKNVINSLSKKLCNNEIEGNFEEKNILKNILEKINKKLSIISDLEKDLDFSEDRLIIVEIKNQTKFNLVASMRTGCINLPKRSRDIYSLDGTCSSVNFTECNEVDLYDYFTPEQFKVKNNTNSLGKYRMSKTCVIRQIS